MKRVVVRQGRDNLLYQEGNQQISELKFSVPVILEYGKKTVIDVIVIMKNGKQIKAQKVYEVR